MLLSRLTSASSQSRKAQTFFLIGHNPALTDLVNALVGDHCLSNLPTAGYVELTLPTKSWRAVPLGAAIVKKRLFPKNVFAS